MNEWTGFNFYESLQNDGGQRWKQMLRYLNDHTRLRDLHCIINSSAEPESGARSRGRSSKQRAELEAEGGARSKMDVYKTCVLSTLLYGSEA